MPKLHPNSPERHEEQHEQEEFEERAATSEALQASVSSSSPITRTVAIIKPHALHHRFDIERRIQEASFEVCVSPCVMPARYINCTLFFRALICIDCQRKANGIRH